MRWEDERYVRVYTRDTVDWQGLSFDAQALFLLLLRKVDRAGLLDLGKPGNRGVAVAIGHPRDWARLEPALEELLTDGCVRVVDEGRRLVVRGFPEDAYPGSRLPTEEVEDGVGLGPPLVRLLTPEERAAKQAEYEANEPARRAAEEERRSRIKGKPHVYFIQQGDSGAIKIGCSKNPSQRLQGLQTGHSEPLRLLTCAVGSQGQERALHDRFAHLRVSGEWFRPAEDLLAYIRLVNDRRAL